MDNKNKIAAVLALMAMCGFLVIFVVLGFGKVPPENKDFFNMGFIALIGFVGTAFGYYLGSSVGSAQKNGIIERVANPVQSVPFDVPDVPAKDAGFARLHLLVGMVAIAAAAVVFLSVMQGCATLQKETPQGLATKSLLTMQETVVSAAQIGDGLCKQRMLNQDQCGKLAVYYVQAGAAYDLAADALIAAVKADATATDQDRYMLAQQQFAVLFGDFMALSTQFGILPALEGGVPPASAGTQPVAAGTTGGAK